MISKGYMELATGLEPAARWWKRYMLNLTFDSLKYSAIIFLIEKHKRALLIYLLGMQKEAIGIKNIRVGLFWLPVAFGLHLNSA
jgi:hypothetical protein